MAGLAGNMVSLIKAVVLGTAMLVSLLAAAVPYWYTFHIMVSYDAGKTSHDKFLDLGLFYMDEGEGIDMIDLVFLNKASNIKVVPEMMRAAQIFFMVGVVAIAVCFVASVIYLVRKYKTVTGEMCLAGAVMPAAVCLLLGVVFAALTPAVHSDAKWKGLPVPGHYMQMDPKPVIEINWGLIVGAVGAVFAIVGSIISWFQACSLCTHIEKVRYRMLRKPITEEEEFGPALKGIRIAQPVIMPPMEYGYSKPGIMSKPGIEMDF